MKKDRQSAPMHAAEIIQERIRTGEFPPGAALPGQRQLAERLGVGRPAIREAISALEGLGLLRVEPGRGVFVSTPGAPSTRRWRYESRYLVEHVYAVRETLESLSVSLATERATASDIRDLHQIVKRLTAAVADDDLLAMSVSDSAFHQRLAELSGNALLQEMLDWFNPVLTESRNIAFANPDSNRRLAPALEHSRIVKAMENRDKAAASRLMKTHILNARSRAQ
jgi:GntR family transcriptional repressor for pyruvate dehydrogenase complex